MALLGYALFTGTYGEFTIPVFEVSGFTIPSGLPPKFLQISTATFNAVQWNFSKDIWNLVPNPPKNTPTSDKKVSPFVCEANPSMELSVCWKTADIAGGTFPDDYYKAIDTWRNGSLADWGTFGRNPNTSVPIIIKLTDEGNKYFLTFSNDEPASNLPDGVVTRFLITHVIASFGFDSVTIQSTPVLIGPAAIDTILIEPSKYSLTFAQSNVFNIHGYKDGEVVEGIEFEVGPLPEEARGVTLIYPFDDDYTKCRVKMPYISDGVAPDDFEVPVQYDGIVRTFKVTFYGHGDAYTPGGSIGGGSGIPSGSGGGGGTFPSSPGPSLVDRIPNGQTGNDIAKSGMFTMYLMNQQYMDLMGDIFWEDNLGIAVLKEIFGNPIDSVISTTSYPFNLVNLASSANQNLFFGPWNTGLPFIALTKSSFQIDWGTIEIPFAWGNFLDYSPYTKMELFLPWGPGYVTIDPNDVSPYSNTPGNFNVSTFSSGSIQVKTNIELGKGTCVHSVIGNNGRVIGTYSGIVGKQIPLTALDTGGKALTTIGAVAGLVGGAAVGSLAAKGALDTGRLTGTPMKDPMRPFESASYWDTGMISGRSTAQSMVSAGANLASRAINSTPITFPRAGTFSDGSSAMTVQEPFLIISRPVQSVPTQYGHYNGYPSNIYVANLKAVSGYTELSEIHLEYVTATADELQELDTILKGGILL